MRNFLTGIHGVIENYKPVPYDMLLQWLTDISGGKITEFYSAGKLVIYLSWLFHFKCMNFVSNDVIKPVKWRDL